MVDLQIQKDLWTIPMEERPSVPVVVNNEKESKIRESYENRESSNELINIELSTAEE